jgi:hypothetical protein
MRLIRRLVAVLAALALLPMAALMFGAALAGLLGCEVNEGGAVPCVVAGADFGPFLSGLVTVGWLELIILPALMGVLALWGVAEGIHVARQRRRQRRTQRFAGAKV